MRTNTTDVLIVGAGPTGLTLATALTARGFLPTVVDRQAAGANTSRAAVVHARTLEVLESIGVADRLVRLGVHAPRFTIRDRDRVLVPVRFDNLPTRYPYTSMISQAVTEAVLLERFTELGGQVLWRRTVTNLAQDDQGVTATLDAAHVHSPAGGQGMNTGIQDAMVLAEALAIALTSGNDEPFTRDHTR